MVGILIGIASLILTAVGLAFARGWLPPKYHMTDSSPYKDPITSRIFDTPGTTSRQATVVVPYLIRQYEGNGYKKVRIAFGHEFRWGRKCVWTGKVSDRTIKECVLMAKSS